ncbi:MAG TPA: hypothetical protein ENO30_05300 [Thermodesulfobium narugense]|nr:hypothetical protein [Thermodesulfobium narugense]
MGKIGKTVRTYTIDNNAIESLKNLSDRMGINEGRIISNIVQTLEKLGILEIAVLSQANTTIIKKILCEKLCSNSHKEEATEKIKEKEERENREEREEREEQESIDKTNKSKGFRYKI